MATVLLRIDDKLLADASRLSKELGYKNRTAFLKAAIENFSRAKEEEREREHIRAQIIREMKMINELNKDNELIAEFDNLPDGNELLD
jgi:metal-responsive CopG/Arc/MetJ family transcriptional regulator